MTNLEDFPVVPRSIPEPRTATLEGSSLNCWLLLAWTSSLNGDPGMWMPFSLACKWWMPSSLGTKRTVCSPLPNGVMKQSSSRPLGATILHSTSPSAPIYKKPRNFFVKIKTYYILHLKKYKVLTVHVQDHCLRNVHGYWTISHIGHSNSFCIVRRRHDINLEKNQTFIFFSSNRNMY